MVTIFHSWKLTFSNSIKTVSKGHEIIGNVKKSKNLDTIFDLFSDVFAYPEDTIVPNGISPEHTAR